MGSNDHQDWPGAASENGDIDQEWVYIRDESLNLTGNYHSAVAFASQVLESRVEFMTKYHTYREDTGRRVQELKDVDVCIWEVSKDSNAVYVRTSTEPAASSPQKCVHILHEGKNLYYPMIPRTWLVDAVANAAKRVMLSTRDVIVRTVRDEMGNVCVQVERWDEILSRWVLSTRMPQVALRKRTQ